MNLGQYNRVPNGYFRNLAHRYVNNQLPGQRNYGYGNVARGLLQATAGSAAQRVYNRYKGPMAPVSNMSERPKRKMKRQKPQSRVTLTKSTDSLKKQVADLKRNISDTEGTLIYRLRGTSRLLSGVNQCNHAQFASNQMSNYEAVLAELRFFDSATPTTLVQASGATATYYREYLFKKVYSHFTAVNNYQVPCKCTIYLCRPKQDTSISPTTAFTDGLTDVGNPSSLSPLVHLTDSDEFSDLWKIDKSESKVLFPGQKLEMFTSDKDIQYSPATFDSHNLGYQKRFHCWAYVVRVEGVLGHDTTVDEQGILGAGVDMMCDQIYTVSYDAGVDLKFIVVTNNSDAFTNSGVISSKPVSDNIGYSVA